MWLWVTIAFVHPIFVSPPNSTALILFLAKDLTPLQSRRENWLSASSSRFGLDNRYLLPLYPYPYFLTLKRFLDGQWNAMPDLLWFTEKNTSLVFVRMWAGAQSRDICSVCVWSQCGGKQPQIREKWSLVDVIWAPGFSHAWNCCPMVGFCLFVCYQVTIAGSEIR